MSVTKKLLVIIKKVIYLILLILFSNPFGLFSPVFKFTGDFFTDCLLKYYGRGTKAVVIDEIHYKENRTLSSGFSYSYLFKVNNKKYKKDAEDTTLKVGDTIKVMYYKNYPSINKRVLSRK